jgi:hypothetical protein
MDEKTESLRDIFTSVSDEDVVTEEQTESHGGLPDEEEIRERLAGVIADLRAEFDVDTELADEQLVDLVMDFYAGETDDTLADTLGVEPTTVRAARFDLHLLRDEDLDAPVEIDRLRSLLDADADTDSIAAELDTDGDTVRRYRRALAASDAVRRTGGRYPDRFESILAEAGVADRFTESVKQDGLEGATADAEVETDF